ncbi:MAG: iron-containing alcohol dehydrogenase family protein [Pyramidobacter sp.]|nr:iron-containing alcohol dehydrogenase family protein [Pyramidobacter sp.]
MKRTLFPGYTVGTDAYDDIPAICAPHGTKAVIIGGHRAMAAAADAICRAAEGSSIKIIDRQWYGGEASVENIERLKAIQTVKDADMIFAVGGGKAIDTCKVLAQRTNRPFFTFPTIASTCASCTSLGILYHPDGSLREYSFSKIPPEHIFINTQVIAEAPEKYLWAGIGDTMAKHYESTTSSRGMTPEHSDAMGITMSSMCAVPMTRWGVAAMEACRNNTVTDELTEVILGIIVSTGLVSNFVQVDYTTGAAHAVYNGFTILPEIEEHHHLHGEIVSYGILILLLMDKRMDEFEKIYAFNKKMGLPTSLADLDTTIDRIPMVAEKALKGIDVRVYPYPVTHEMIVSAVKELEDYSAAHPTVSN